MILVSSCWEKNFIRNNAHNFFILSLVFFNVLLLIVSVAFFLGHYTLYISEIMENACAVVVKKRGKYHSCKLFDTQVNLEYTKKNHTIYSAPSIAHPRTLFRRPCIL